MTQPSSDYIKKLGLEVSTRNKVNRIANEAAYILRGLFAEREGHKVQKVYGKLFMAIQREIKQALSLLDLNDYRYYFIETSCYDITFVVDATYQWGESCFYVKAAVCVAELRDGIVQPFQRICSPLECNYTVGAVLGEMDRIKELEMQLSQAKSAIHEFQRFGLYS